MVLLDIIKNNSNWRDIIEDNNIYIQEKNGYALFKYGIGSDFSSQLVKECRGTIVDISDEKDPYVVCRPFDKFEHYDVEYADKIDWSTAKITEKLDGSLIKLWYSDRENRLIWSTMGNIYAEDAPLSVDSEITIRNFLDLIKICPSYHSIMIAAISVVDKFHTHLFELTSPYTQVVCKHDRPRLNYICSRVNSTGEENMRFLYLEAMQIAM